MPTSHDVNTLIGLKVQGVTPAYVRELRAAGLTVTADQVIGLKVQDVSPQYLKGCMSRELIHQRIKYVTGLVLSNY